MSVLQVWYQQDLMPFHEDMLAETEAREGKGAQFWHWHVRGLEHLNQYLTKVMKLGNHLGKKLGKKLDGDPRKASFGGVMVRNCPRALLPLEGVPQSLAEYFKSSCDHHYPAEQATGTIAQSCPATGTHSWLYCMRSRTPSTSPQRGG